jgi:hypothetical protein
MEHCKENLKGFANLGTLILLKNHNFGMLFWMPAEVSATMAGIDESTGFWCVRLTVPSWYNNIYTGLGSLSFTPLSLPLLPSPIHAPLIPDWNFTIAPPPKLELTPPFGFVYDHLELQPGAQSTFPIGGRRQDAFVLTMQSVYRRGSDEGSHTEADLGVQIGAPFTAIPANGAPWTFNPFVQLTDVDRLGPLGFFHFWQPYAQIGAQISGPGDPQPTITGNLFPVNLGLDVGDLLTVGLGTGLAFSLDLRTMNVQVAPQVTFGISLKLGRPTGPL